MKKYIFLAVSLILVPSTLHAVWWNPATWNDKSKEKEVDVNLASEERIIPFAPISIFGTDEIRCTVDETGGIYDRNNSSESQEVVAIQNLKKDTNPIKFTFKIDGNDVKILIGDAGGVSETNGVVLVNNEDKIHMMNSWGLFQDNIQAFTIYPKTGFFTWVRMGDLMLLYNSLGFGYGRCF